MAYIDTNLEFSDAQAITATAISEDVYDTLSIAAGAGSTGISGGGATTDLGQSATGLYLVVTALTAAAGGDSAKTLTITLESDSTANLATSATVHYTSTAILGSAITAGARLVTIALPHGLYERYLGLRFTVSASFTSFTVDAYMTLDPAGVYRASPTNFVVV